MKQNPAKFLQRFRNLHIHKTTEIHILTASLQNKRNVF